MSLAEYCLKLHMHVYDYYVLHIILYCVLIDGSAAGVLIHYYQDDCLQTSTEMRDVC